MDYIFKTETIHDLSVHRQFRKGYQYANRLTNILFLILIPELIFLLFHLDIPVSRYCFLFLGIFRLLTLLSRNSKKGDLAYRRMLLANNGEPSHTIYYLRDDGIHCVNRRNGGSNRYDYSQVKLIIEYEDLLILVMPLRLCLLLQKRWLLGGTREDLLKFLFDRCTGIRRKKLRGIRFGQWIQGIQNVLMIIGILAALLHMTYVSPWDLLTGKLHNKMTYQEMAEELAPLGITVREETVREMEAYDAEYAEAFGDYYRFNPDSSKIQDLLCWEGMGNFDPDTFVWTPSNSGIFWMDGEAWHENAIYTDFFTGICAMHEELAFTNIHEDYSRVDWDAGTGTVIISFEYERAHYTMEAEFFDDWFDTDFLLEVIQITHSDEKPGNLYFAIDGGQGYYIYYGEPGQVRLLERKSGLDFMDTWVPSPFH